MPRKITAPKVGVDPRHRIIDTSPRTGHQVVPGWYIETDGLTHWGAAEHLLWRGLLANAWGPELDDPRRDFEINLADLRGTHDSNDRLRKSLETLQKTLLVLRLNGRTRKVQMLGMTDMDDSDREVGILRYDYPKGLIAALREPGAYAQIDLKAEAGMTSKYSRNLHAIVAKRVGLRKPEETIPLDTFRSWMGVPDGKLETWSNFNKFALQPALMEVNGLSRFSVIAVPVKRGKAVAEVMLSWAKKDPGTPEEREAVREANRHHEGRKHRLTGTVQQVVDVHTSRAPLLPTPAAIDRARSMAGRARLDYHAIEQDFQSWAKTLTEPPRSLDAVFLNFVKKQVDKNGRG